MAFYTLLFLALEYTGGVPYDVLKPIMEKVTVEQLYTFENYNPYLIGETDELWEYHCKRHFRTAKRQELETWRDVYLVSITDFADASDIRQVKVTVVRLSHVTCFVMPINASNMLHDLVTIVFFV